MNDLIERNAVMLRVREFIGNPSYDELMLVNDLNALPSAESKQCAENAQWIPVGERPPEEGVEVLVTGTDGSMRVSTLTDITFWKGIGRGNVLAWMPLPEPYKEKA